jgi:hypothetical protein
MAGCHGIDDATDFFGISCETRRRVQHDLERIAS